MKQNKQEAKETTNNVWPPAPLRHNTSTEASSRTLLLKNNFAWNSAYISLILSVLGGVTGVYLQTQMATIFHLSLYTAFHFAKYISATVLLVGLVAGIMGRSTWLGKAGMIITSIFLIIVLNENMIG